MNDERRRSSYIGRCFALHGLRVLALGGEEKDISGRMEVVDYERDDRLGSPYFVLVPEGTEDDEWGEKAVTCAATALDDQLKESRI